MATEPQLDGPVPEPTRTGIDRRTLIKGGALAAGTAWVAPAVMTSLASAAAPGTITTFPFTSSTPDTYHVWVPVNKVLNYTITGGGGGGGFYNAYNGGSGVTIMGTIAKNTSTATC